MVEISRARKCFVAGGQLRLVTEDFAEEADLRGHCNCIEKGVVVEARRAVPRALGFELEKSAGKWNGDG